MSRTWAIGGAQTILLTLLGSLPRDAFEIIVVPYESGTAADRDFARAAEAAGATLAEPLHWHGFRDWRRAQAALAGIVDRYRIDLVHSHDNLSNTLVAFNGSLRRPIVATAFGWWELNAKLKAYYAVERRFVLPRFDAVYTVSNDMKAKIVRGGTSPERVAVIHTGLDAARFAPRGRRSAARAALGIASDALVVGAVGRISVEKGHQHLLRAVQRLPRHDAAPIVLLAGTGPDVGPLKVLAAELGIADRLVMPGYVADSSEVLEALDVAVLPSVLDEGFPTASIEAQASGLPIVASDIGGTRETLIDGTTGLLCPPGDDAALADALGRLLDDAALRQRMGATARRRIQTDFTVDGMLGAIAGLYDRVLAGTPQASRR